MKTIVFHINSFLAGGIEKVLLELLHALDPAKYNIRLSIAHSLGELEILKHNIPAYVSVNYILDKPIYNAAKKKKIKGELKLPQKLASETFLPVFKKQVFKKRLKEIIEDADVIVDFDLTLAGYYKLLQGKKTIAYSHFSMLHDWGRGNKTRKKNKLVNRLSHYDKIITICDEMKQDIAATYPMLADRLVRLYNSLDFDKIKAAAKEDIAGEDIPPHYIISVGRLAESQKDFTAVIKGYAACIKKHGLTKHLVIAGDGNDKEKLQQLASTEGVAGKVHFIGFQHNPYKWMSKAGMFVFGSKNEGLPTVLIEALFLQLPIIATQCKTGVREILMDGQAGTLVPVSDSEAIGEAIDKMINNKSLQKTYIENSKKIISEFDIKNVIRDFERIINQ